MLFFLHRPEEAHDQSRGAGSADPPRSWQSSPRLQNDAGRRPRIRSFRHSPRLSIESRQATSIRQSDPAGARHPSQSKPAQGDARLPDHEYLQFVFPSTGDFTIKKVESGATSTFYFSLVAFLRFTFFRPHPESYRADS